MEIKRASKELYSKLRIYDEVVGIGVCRINDTNYIVVYLAKITKKILEEVPSVYKGNSVKTEVTGDIFLQ